MFDMQGRLGSWDRYERQRSAPRMFAPIRNGKSRPDSRQGSTPSCSRCGKTVSLSELMDHERMCVDCHHAAGSWRTQPPRTKINLSTPVVNVKVERGAPPQAKGAGDPSRIGGDKFEVGQTVRCIEFWEGNCGHGPQPRGSIYTITAINPLGLQFKETGDVAHWKPSRFELATSAPAAAETALDVSKIEAGDWIKLRRYSEEEAETNPPWDLYVGKSAIIERQEWVQVESIGCTGVIAKYCFPLCAITHHSKTWPVEGAARD